MNEDDDDDDDDDDDEDGRRIIPIALGLSAGGLKRKIAAALFRRTLLE